MTQWSKLFPQRIFDRGEIYFENQMVQSVQLASDKEHFTAQVQGGIGRYYNVSGRLRPDGRASELKCACPWAKKGHRCKHQVAVLMAAEEKQKNADENTDNSSKVDFKNLVSDKVKQAVIQASPAVDPFELIGQRTFSQESYDRALQLSNSLQEINFRRVDDKMRAYEYIWNFENENGNWQNLCIKFTRWQLLTIDFENRTNIKYEDAIIIFALLKFLEEYIKDDPFDVTNQAANQLLDLYSDNDNQTTSAILLRAQIDNYDRMLRLTFKLGKEKHLYQINDLNGLIDAIHKQTPVNLGKFFNEPIDPNQMTQDSKKWLDFIVKIIDARNLSVYYGGSSHFDSIEIENSIADEVNDLIYNGTKLYSGTHLVGYTSDQLDLNINITDDKGGAIVSIEDFPTGTIIAGRDNYYGYYKGVWIKYTGLTPHYLQKLKLHPGDELRFSKKTVLQFARKVLPALEKADHISIEGAQELKKKLPPKARFIFKLDYLSGKIRCTAMALYGDNAYQLNRDYAANDKREADLEESIQNKIKSYFTDFDNGQYILPNEDADAVADFFDNGLKKLKELGEVQITANFRSLLRGIKINSQIGVSINLTNELLNVDLTSQKLSLEDIQNALKAYQEKKRYFVLQNGMLQKTEQPTIEQLAQTMHDLNIKFTDFIHGKLQIPAYRAFYFAKQMKSMDALHFSINDAFNRLINDLSNNQTQRDAIPQSLQNTLRPYQKAGFNWLSTIVNYDFGSLLADEMGLGKTLQIITLFLARKEQKKSNLPSLVIAPASVIYNWQAEIKKFAPELSVGVLGGTKKERHNILLHQHDYDVFITSYQSLNHDLEAYHNLDFDLQILDEAQNIKNHQSITAQSVKVIKSQHRLALTGTPIENKLSELWSIFDYLMPGFLGSYVDFRKKFEVPIVKKEDKDLEAILSETVAPFILRRLKKDVLKDLPAKDEEVVYVKMSKQQTDLYQLQMQKIIAQLNGQDDNDFKKSRFQILAQITKLREICCEPHLLYNNYHGKSNKLSSTVDLIKNNIENGHKILLFSQFTSMLDILHERLAKLKIPIFTLTGATPKEKRQEDIQQFNSLKTPSVFLISLKAGGTGINLTSADVVIHYDPWWNIAAENQATDRAHRIGQKNSVKIYKIVTRDTIEERIIKLQQKKAELAQVILGNKNMSNTTMSRKDLLRLLK